MCLGLIFALATLGGQDTVRYLYWAAPIVLLMIALSLEDLSKDFVQTPRWRIVLGATCLLLAQLASSWVFLPIDKFLTLRLMNRDWLAPQSILLFLGIYLVVFCGLWVMMRLIIKPVDRSLKTSGES